MSPKEQEVRRRIWWTIASLDALLCLLLGRPSAITYYNTQLPRDLPDGTFTEDGLIIPNDPLGRTTDNTYHAAYFALTIPSFEILRRVFHLDRQFSRIGSHDWFVQSDPHSQFGFERTGTSTYEDVIRLDEDIVAWYNSVPAGLRFDAEKDTADVLRRDSSKSRVNQILMLTVKIHMVRLILHRPYLRADPDAYPRSTEICFDAAHSTLRACVAMYETNSSILWSWWTLTLRAFHAAAVCAFLAIRQPHNPRAEQCLEDVRAAKTILGGRLPTWRKNHPVQYQLCEGLESLERLATAATQQSKGMSQDQNGDSLSTSMGGQNVNRSDIQGFPTSFGPGVLPQYSTDPALNFAARPPTAGSLPIHRPPTMGGQGEGGGVGGAGSVPSGSPFPLFPQQQPNNMIPGQASDATLESMALPQFWAEMFGLPANQIGSPGSGLQLNNSKENPGHT